MTGFLAINYYVVFSNFCQIGPLRGPIVKYIFRVCFDAADVNSANRPKERLLGNLRNPQP